MTQRISSDELSFSDKNGYIEFQFRGEFSVASAKQVVDAMIAECAVRKCRRALLDCRPMRGDMAIVDRFDVVSYAVKTRETIDRTAIVGRTDQMLPDKFVETVAANRGFTVRVFGDPVAAEQWLRS